MQEKRNPTVEEIGRLTLREFYEQYYFDPAEHSKRSWDGRRGDLNKWERFTDNPPLCEITHDTAAQFRAGAVEADLAAYTIKSTWKIVRAILKRSAPSIQGNPRGMGLLFHDGLPYMVPVKGPRRTMPRRLTMDEMTNIYVACKKQNTPKHLPYPPADWWRALFVMAYCTGLRRSDLLDLQWNQIDWKDRTLTVTANKTQKTTIFPLHDAVITHLERIRSDVSPFIFNGTHRERGGSFNIQVRRISKAAKVDSITFKNFRQTAASEAERVRPGGGGLLLQHSQSSVTAIHYLVTTEELRELVAGMRMPVGFSSGAKLSTRIEKKRKEKNQQLHPSNHDTGLVHVPSNWSFYPGGFEFCGKPYYLYGFFAVILETLATSPEGRATKNEIYSALQAAGYAGPERLVINYVSRLRTRLRAIMGLQGWQPIPTMGGMRPNVEYSLRIPEHLAEAGE